MNEEEITINMTPARKGRKTSFIVLGQVVPGRSWVCMCYPIRLCRHRFCYFVVCCCSIPIVPIGYQVILQNIPLCSSRYMPAFRGKFLCIYSIPIVECSKFLNTISIGRVFIITISRCSKITPYKVICYMRNRFSIFTVLYKFPSASYTVILFLSL
jgi:hypothetical protein